jgi:protein-tyrosine-phosphatase
MNSPTGKKPSVLFVCRHNTGRSQMAEAYLRQYLGDGAEIASAGTVAAESPDPGVVAAMAEDGIDISSARPKLIDLASAQRAERINTMGCDVAGVPRIDAIGDSTTRKALRRKPCARSATA